MLTLSKQFDRLGYDHKHANRKQSNSRKERRLTLEHMEPRTMFSATLGGGLAAHCPTNLTGAALVSSAQRTSGVGAVSSTGAMHLASSSVLTSTTLMAKGISSTQVSLSWSSVPAATNYVIDMWSNGAWVQLGVLGSGTTGCTVTNLQPGTTYYFDVGSSRAGQTMWSNVGSATTITDSTTIDHPAAAAGAVYSPVNGQLFGANGPSFLDVYQGGVGDCWLLSSLAEVAARDPQDIRNMFTYQGTAVENGATVGLYKVRFFENGVAKYVTVDTELPMGGATYDRPANGVLWVALAEKAYAEANGAGYVTTQHVGTDSYAALDGGQPTWALQAITGLSASFIAVNPSNIAAAWNAGKLVVLGSSSNANDNLIVGDSQGLHAYAMVNYNASSSTPFELFNPWHVTATVNSTFNWNGHQVYGGAFYASVALVANDFSSVSTGFGAEANNDTKHAATTAADRVFAEWTVSPN